MGILVDVVVVVLIVYVVSGRAAWLVPAVRSPTFLVCTGIWALVVAVVLVANGWSPFFFVVLFGIFTIVLVALAPWEKGGSGHVESRQTPPLEQGNKEPLVEPPVEEGKEALIRAWGHERSELCSKKPISAASPADREKNRLLGDICIERLKWLAKKKDTP